MNEDVVYLKNILVGIVSYPDEVSIIRSVDDMGVLLTVKLAKEDMGRVIGKSGKTINAIRHVVKCFGYSINSELNIRIQEPVI